MRYVPLLFLLLGCNPGVPRLHNVRSVTIKYGSRDGINLGFADNYRQIEVSNAEDVQRLVDAFQVQRTGRGLLAAAFPGMVEFHLADGSKVRCWFVKPDWVEWDSQGELYLRDRTFYDRVNALLSRKEGHPIDILKPELPNNPKWQQLNKQTAGQSGGG